MSYRPIALAVFIARFLARRPERRYTPPYPDAHFS